MVLLLVRIISETNVQQVVASLLFLVWNAGVRCIHSKGDSHPNVSKIAAAPTSLDAMVAPVVF